MVCAPGGAEYCVPQGCYVLILHRRVLHTICARNPLYTEGGLSGPGATYRLWGGGGCFVLFVHRTVRHIVCAGRGVMQGSVLNIFWTQEGTGVIEGVYIVCTQECVVYCILRGCVEKEEEGAKVKGFISRIPKGCVQRKTVHCALQVQSSGNLYFQTIWHLDIPGTHAPALSVSHLLYT